MSKNCLFWRKNCFWTQIKRKLEELKIKTDGIFINVVLRKYNQVLTKKHYMMTARYHNDVNFAKYYIFLVYLVSFTYFDGGDIWI